MRLTVFAAASLTDALPALDASPTYQFAASDTLATQVTEGAGADVFAAANMKLPDALYKQGIVDKPIVFAANHVVLIVPTSSKIASLQDLLDDRSATIVLAHPGVPLGDYTIKVLQALNLSSLADRAKSLESDAHAVTTKIVLQEADAGFVYATDARPFNTRLRVIELPATDANHATYGAAVVTDSKYARQAHAYLNRLTSDEGRAALQDDGFDLPPSDTVAP